MRCELPAVERAMKVQEVVLRALSSQVSGTCGDATAPRTIRALTRRAVAA